MVAASDCAYSLDGGVDDTDPPEESHCRFPMLRRQSGLEDPAEFTDFHHRHAI